MDRLISEFEVIRAIEKYVDNIFTKNMGDLVKDIKAISSVDKWISVSERLPKDEQEVLITYKINGKHHVWSGIWDKLRGKFYDKKYSSYISLDYVTAWMPLPKPYKAESEE